MVPVAPEEAQLGGGLLPAEVRILPPPPLYLWLTLPCLYSPSCREHAFPETGLPVSSVLGNPHSSLMLWLLLGSGFENTQRLSCRHHTSQLKACSLKKTGVFI